MAWLTRQEAAAMSEEDRLDYLTKTVLGEAVGEGLPGMLVVAQVIANRTMNAKDFSADPVAVAGQKFQFSTNNPFAYGGNQQMVMGYGKNTTEYQQARAAVEAAIINKSVPDITGGSEYYHTTAMGWPSSWPSRIKQYGFVDIGGHRVYPNRPITPGEIPANLARATEFGVASLLDVRSQGLKPIRPATLSSALTLQRETNRVASARANAPETIRRARTFAFGSTLDPFEMGRPANTDPIINRPEPAMRESMQRQLRATGTPNSTARTFALQEAAGGGLDGDGAMRVSTALARPPATAVAPWGVRETVAAQVASAAADNGRNQMVMTGNPNIAGSVVQWLYPQIEEGTGEANQEGKGDRAVGRSFIERAKPRPGQSQIERATPTKPKPGQSIIERDPPKPDAYDAGSQDEWAQRNRQLNIAAQEGGGVGPAAVRTFAGSVLGDRSPIDETSFNNQELGILADAVARAQADGRDYIGYGDFGEVDPWAQGTRNAVQTVTDTGTSVANTLGMAKFSIKKDGSIVIEDSYDFNATRASTDEFVKDQGGVPQALMAGFVRNGLLGVGNVIGNLTLPEGEGRPVRITIPFDKANIARRSGQSIIERTPPRRDPPIVQVQPNGKVRVVPQSIIERDDVVTQSVRRANEASDPVLATTLANQIATKRAAADVRTIREANQAAAPALRSAVTAETTRTAADTRLLRNANQNAAPVVPGPRVEPKAQERLASLGGLDFIDPPRSPPRQLPPIAPPRSNPIGIMPDFRELARMPADPLRPVAPSKPAPSAEIIPLPRERPLTTRTPPVSPASVAQREVARGNPLFGQPKEQAPIPFDRPTTTKPTTRTVPTTRVTTTAPPPASVEDRVTARNKAPVVATVSRSAPVPATRKGTTPASAANSPSPSQSSSGSGSGGSQAPTYVRASTGESLSPVTVRSYDPDTNSFSSKTVYR